MARDVHIGESDAQTPGDFGCGPFLHDEEIKNLKKLTGLGIQLTAILPEKIEKIKKNLPKNCEVTVEVKTMGKMTNLSIFGN